ncbi:NAD(P)H-binding protein [Prauserella cavernicola]|uniref:NAD(P)H-binding protein n=1 Tax=Prauserella cavernicola TaxID=2800127 RepID=A0A934QNH5_9PSEU|nr:NAD(P)H-binding protein [Prauserella cavernicola]MBK1783063.1 NAD(P)H-binding protein [Prauserella cavernicola]
MTILVTGATGNIGRMVVDELSGRGLKVRALTTNPAKAALPDDVEVFRGYVGKPETMTAALEGVEKLYLPPIDTVDTIADMAKKAGVRHVVALTSILAADGNDDEYSLSFVAIERALRDSGLDWTFLRPGAFMENTTNWVESVRTESMVRAPFPQSSDTATAMSDIAALAAVALSEAGHENQIYKLSGPEQTTIPGQVRALAEALGRDLRYVEQTKDEAKQEFLGGGVDDETAEWLLAGGPDLRVPVEHDFERATGRPPITYAEWARRNADLFR